MFSLLWVCQLGLYKTSLYSKHNDAKTKNFKLKILVYIINHQTLMEITHHQTLNPFQPNTPYFPASFAPNSASFAPNSASFAALETLGGRLQLVFEFQKQMNNV
jgi:hypothetical protein